MNTKEIKQAIRATMLEFGYKTNKIAVELDGKVCYLTETQVRALQVMVMRDPQLRESIKVYNGRTKRGSEVMTLTEYGYFNEPFHNGFYDINTKLSRALMF